MSNLHPNLGRPVDPCEMCADANVERKAQTVRHELRRMVALCKECAAEWDAEADEIEQPEETGFFCHPGDCPSGRL